MPDSSYAEEWNLLPEEILSELKPDTVELIVKSVIDDAKRARIQAWFSLVLAFLTIPALIVLAWHFVDKDAPTQGAAVITSGAVGLVGLFLGARATSNWRKRARIDAAQNTSARAARVRKAAKKAPKKAPPSSAIPQQE
jgi:hypothetical protein